MYVCTLVRWYVFAFVRFAYVYECSRMSLHICVRAFMSVCVLVRVFVFEFEFVLVYVRVKLC